MTVLRTFFVFLFVTTFSFVAGGPVAALAAELAAEVVVYETSESVDTSVDLTLKPPKLPTRTAPLLGSARITSPLCAVAAAILGPGAMTCTVTGSGTAVPTGADPVPGAVIAALVRGDLFVVIEAPLNATNTADAPEIVVTTATFQAAGIQVEPIPNATKNGLKKKLERVGFPVLLRIIGGTVTIGSNDPAPFDGLFRLPFALSKDGNGGDDDDVETPRRGKPAFYLSDTGRLIKVGQDERAIGFATPRLEVTINE